VEEKGAYLPEVQGGGASKWRVLSDALNTVLIRRDESFFLLDSVTPLPEEDSSRATVKGALLFGPLESLNARWQKCSKAQSQTETVETELECGQRTPSTLKLTSKVVWPFLLAFENSHNLKLTS
jgi:hypothetical protein